MASAVNRAQRAVPHLRTVAALVTALLTLLVVTSSVLLLVLSARGRAGVHDREMATEHIRTMQGVRVALLDFAVHSDLAYLTKSPADERRRLDSEASVIAGIDQERHGSMDAQQRSAFTNAEGLIKEYLLARRQAEAKRLPIQDVLLATSTPLNAALGAAGREVDLASARELRANAAARARLNHRDLILSSAGAVLLLGFLGALVGLRRLVLLPLLDLGDAIRGFAAGDRLARAREDGAAEFQGTAHTFNQLVDHMVRQEEQRLAFLAGVAHDLRNPLAALRMSTHLLRPGVPLPPEDNVRNTMALVDRQVTRLERMVADFLDASRIESGHLELRFARHDLQPLAAEAVELYAASSYSHQLQLLGPDEPLAVRCDSTRIEQVLNNLVSNAIKYSPLGGPVTVALSRSDGFAVIEVVDRGIGIAADELQHVFEPFRRTGASRESIPGVGLGLWVSRRIVEAHGGTLEVTSELGAGSTFRVRLPLAPRVEAGDAASPPKYLH
jgi:two-component system sensor histidine kinase MtrB